MSSSTPLPVIDDAWVLAQRGPKRAVVPGRAYGVSVERERQRDGALEDVLTVLTTNRECPLRCLMCDLWQSTLDEPSPSGSVADQHGEIERQITCSLLVDAAGLGPAVRPRHWRTHTRASFAHFEDVPRIDDLLDGLGIDRADDPFAIDDAVIHLVTERGWLWLIRFDDGRVSAGFVEPFVGETVAAPHAKAFVATLPSLPRHLLEQARSITPVHSSERLQWMRPDVPGPLFVRLPSAFGFVDPLHSAGNAHTLAGVRRVLAAVRSERPLQKSIDHHHARTRCELDHLDRIIGVGYESMSDASRFEPWSMLYFVAATMSEQAIRYGSPDDADTGFLMAADSVFAPLVDAVVKDASLRAESPEILHEILGARFAPWNRAGLWDPSREGIYPFIELDRSE